MPVLLAAIDDSAAARPVLEAARRLGSLFDASPIAVHVAEDGSGATARAVCEAAHVPLRLRRGDARSRLVELAGSDEVVAIVAGTRRAPVGATPAGHVAMHLIEGVGKPVVVVPPAPAASRPLRRVLVPVDDDPATWAALRPLLARLIERSPAEIVALHVFEPDRIPPYSDHTGHEAEAWTTHFLDRCFPGADEKARVEVRIGLVPEAVPAVVAEVDPDLVVIAWHQDLTPGRALVVRTLLARAAVPLLLVPAPAVARSSARSASMGRQRERTRWSDA